MLYRLHAVLLINKGNTKLNKSPIWNSHSCTKLPYFQVCAVRFFKVCFLYLYVLVPLLVDQSMWRKERKVASVEPTPGFLSDQVQSSWLHILMVSFMTFYFWTLKIVSKFTVQSLTILHIMSKLNKDYHVFLAKCFFF